MGRGLVAVGYAIGAGLVLAHRRKLIPKPLWSTWDTSCERGFGATWFGVELSIWRPKRAERRG